MFEWGVVWSRIAWLLERLRPFPLPVVDWIGEVAAPDGAWALQGVGAGGRAACFFGYVDHGEPVGVGGCSVVGGGGGVGREAAGLLRCWAPRR